MNLSTDFLRCGKFVSQFLRLLSACANFGAQFIPVDSFPPYGILLSIFVMQNREKQITQTTLIGSLANALLTAGKILAGIWGNSGAMLADGLHSLSDFISDIVVLVCVKISAKGQDKDHDFGHGKYETLATLCVGVLLFVVGIELLWSGGNKIYAFFNGGLLESPEYIALWAALISIVVKELLYQYTARVGKRVSSPVVVANAWHHRTDALSSIGSALGIGGAILLGEKWTILDPIACCIISVFIIVVAVEMAGPSINELLEASLSDEMENEILEIARSVNGVNDVHDLRSRKSGPNNFVEVHVVVNPELTVLIAHDIATEVEQKLKGRFGNELHISIHIEPSENAK